MVDCINWSRTLYSCFQLATGQHGDDKVLSASWSLVFEWAQKLLGKGFTDVHNLAECLVANSYVNTRSAAAFTVLAASQQLPPNSVSSQKHGM